MGVMNISGVVNQIANLLMQRSFVSRHFALTLDGSEMAGFLRSVEGGGIKAEVVQHQIGGSPYRDKQIGQPGYDPFTVQVGMSMSKSFYKWMADSWAGNVSRRTGSVVCCDHNLFPRHEVWFDNALITETTFPNLDGASKEPANMTVKFQPETSRHQPPSVTNLFNPAMITSAFVQAVFAPMQKLWSGANFRLQIDGLDCSKVSKIDGFTIKQGTVRVPTGEDRDYQLEPGNLEFPNLSVTMSLASAQSWLDWHKSFVVDGNNSAEREKLGVIQLLSPDRLLPLVNVLLFGVGIYNLALDKGDASSDGIRRVKAELYVERMEILYLGDFFGFGLF